MSCDEYIERLGSACVEHWRGRLADSTWYVMKYLFREYIEWLGEHGGVFSGFGPDELVEWQRGHPYSYELLDLVQEWAQVRGRRVGYLEKRYGCVKSFFRHNRVALPEDPGFRLRGSKPPVSGSLTVPEFRRVLASCNRMYRAVFLCMFMGGLGAGELVYWSNHGLGELLEQLDRERYIRVDLPGRKRRRNVTPYYTFLGRDAIDALRRYMEVRREGNAIFLTQFGTPLCYKTMFTYWNDHQKRLGLIPAENTDRGRRYGKNIHEIRDLFRTRWRRSGVDTDYAEYFMGHTEAFDQDGYDKIYRDEAHTKRMYMRAEPWLNIVSDEPDKISTEDHELELRRQREEMDQRIAKIVRNELAKERLKRRE